MQNLKASYDFKSYVSLSNSLGFQKQNDKLVKTYFLNMIVCVFMYICMLLFLKPVIIAHAKQEDSSKKREEPHMTHAIWQPVLICLSTQNQ